VSGVARAGKILVVDDHVDLAENLAEILDGAGYQAVTAASAEAGLARMAAGDVIALITDFRLPGMNGAQLIAEVRKNGYRVPAIVMSAFTDDETIDVARAAGAADVLSKPVQLDRLMMLVAAMTKGETVVLLVDDNRELAENLAEILQSHHHSAAICGSLAEVRALSTTPTLAVLDYRLPDGTGVDVAKDLLARNAGTRIMYISGYGAELEARLGGEPSVRAQLLEKPVNIQHLLGWVTEALGRGTTTSPRR
jgi:DNA-binding response OmpR family regulator